MFETNCNVRWWIMVLIAIVQFNICCGKAVMATTPTSIERKGTITVIWKGIESPHEGDIIAVFSPPSVQDFQKNLTAHKIESWKEGAGTAKFHLLNMRQDYIFRYLSKGETDNYKVIAESNIVTVKPFVPMGGHISYTQNPSEMRVMWVSNAPKNSTATVMYGLQSGQLTMKQSGITTTYNLSDLCSHSKGGEWSYQYWWDPGMIHDAVLTGLKPRTKYYYRFGTDYGWSEEFSFISKQTDPHAELNFIAFGDSGVSECEEMYGWCEKASGMTTALIKEDLQQKDYDMLLHIGDIAYAVGHAVRWDQFFHQIEPIATRLPYQVCIGNHEYDYIGQDFMPDWADYGDDSHGECGVPFNKRFNMPANGNGNLWWSINYGPIHFVFISTEHNFTQGSAQYQWLVKDLQSVNRSITPWVILSGHRPMYTTWNYKPVLKFSEKMRDILEDLFVKYVDIAFWGHVHNYERSCPVYNGKCMGDLDSPKSTVHFVIGMGGQTYFFDWTEVQPEWSMFRVAQYGYIRIHIPQNNHKQLLIQYRGDKDAMIHDDVWITNRHI